MLPGDAEWPAAIDDLGDHAPAVLWVRGDPTHLVVPSRVSIVGARAATAYGDTVAAELAGDLAATGSVVVSGGAYGIDGSAHRAALGAGGGTIAFLAGGVDRAYPAGHQHLFDRIRESGALVSELPCGAAPTKFRFLSRNRLIAALADATVVVEAGWRSGSLNTAGHASSLGRPLGTVPGPITSAASAGCHRLMREYDAQCVTNAAEVRELMGTEAAEVPEPQQRTESDQTRLLDAMSTRTSRRPAELARVAGLSEERAAGHPESGGTRRARQRSLARASNLIRSACTRPRARSRCARHRSSAADTRRRHPPRSSLDRSRSPRPGSVAVLG